MKIMIVVFSMLSSTFMLISHPLSLGLNLILQTIMISLSTGTMNSVFWFSYILFLVMIGGMLILFIYMTSIASNEKFKYSNKITLMSLMMLILIFIAIKNIEQINFMIKFKEVSSYLDINNNMNQNMKFFSPKISIIMIMAMMYLLLTMIMIVKITKKIKGPLRQKN